MERDSNSQPRRKKRFMSKSKVKSPPDSVSDTITTASSTNETSTSEKLTTGNEQYAIDIDAAAETNLVVVDEPPVATEQESQQNNLIEVQSKDNPATKSAPTPETMDNQLPENVTKLITANGTEVYLVGTAHFSTKSADDVKKVIQDLRPSSVILELCRERAFMLTLDEASLLEQNTKLSVSFVRGAIAEKGFAQGLIYVLFIKMSASLTEALGMAPGSEFRVGAAEAQKIPGCSVILGDRSLKVTVARAVASISTWQKIKLIYQVLMNNAHITPEDVEKFKNKDILEQLLEELGVEFPGFKKVLLDERNIYLAHSIYRWSNRLINETSMGPPRVVAIVGIGHVGGIISHWGTTTDEVVNELDKLPIKRKPTRTRQFVKICIYFGLAYLGYRTLAPSSVQHRIADASASLIAAYRPKFSLQSS